MSQADYMFRRAEGQDEHGEAGCNRKSCPSGLENLKPGIIHIRGKSDKPKHERRDGEHLTFHDQISYRSMLSSEASTETADEENLQAFALPFPSKGVLHYVDDKRKFVPRLKDTKEKKEYKKDVKMQRSSISGTTSNSTVHEERSKVSTEKIPLPKEYDKKVSTIMAKYHTTALVTDDMEDDFLLCKVCRSDFDEKDHIPRVLPCLHTFCQRCLERHVRDLYIYCPNCKSRYTLPNDSVKNLPKESTRRSLRDFLLVKRRTKMQCRDCPDGSKAGYFCKNCYSFMCNECKHAHLRNFISRDHSIFSISQLQNAGIDPFLRQQTCEISGHEGQNLVFFCANKECCKPVCKVCTVLEHKESKGHTVRRIAKVYEDQITLISKLFKSVEDRITFIKNLISEIEEEMKGVGKKYLKISNEIDKEIDESIQELEARRQDLKGNLKSKCVDKRNILQKQMEDLKYNLIMMNSGREFTLHMMSHAMPAEFVILTDTIAARLSMLKDKQTEPCPIENSFMSFDKDKMGSAFKAFVTGMGKIRSTAIYPPKTMAETFDVPKDNYGEIMKLFLYDNKGNPQKDSSDCVQIHVVDPRGKVSSATVEDAKTVDGCYRVHFTASLLGQHRAIVRVLGRLVKVDGYPFQAKNPGEIDKIYGNITCPGFGFDVETVHSERQVMANGRVLRSDVTTLKRSTARRIKKTKGSTFPWDKVTTKQDTAKARPEARSLDTYESQLHYVDDSAFVGKRLERYCGVLGTKKFHTPGRLYYEVTVNYRIHINLVRNALIFEIGIGRWDAIYNSFYVGAQSYAWSFAVERCNEHKQLCHKFRHKRILLTHSPVSADTAGTSLTIHYGFLLDTNSRQWTILDTENQKILYTFRNIDFSEPLWPVFGAYNPYSAHIEMQLKTGSSISRIPALATLV